MMLYQIPDSVTHTHIPASPMGLSMCLRCMLDMHIADGQLVAVEPDMGAAAQAIYETWDSVGRGAQEMTHTEAANIVLAAALGEGTT